MMVPSTVSPALGRSSPFSPLGPRRRLVVGVRIPMRPAAGLTMNLYRLRAGTEGPSKFEPNVIAVTAMARPGAGTPCNPRLYSPVSWASCKRSDDDATDIDAGRCDLSTPRGRGGGDLRGPGR